MLHARCARFLAALTIAAAIPADVTGADTGSVIFIHPDGTSAATWAAARALLVGPDGELEWDRLPRVGVYRGHVADNLTSTSHGGATVHASGVKVSSSAYGRTRAGPDGRDLLDEDGRSLRVTDQAIARGIPVGLVQSGRSTEPGTGCFVVGSESRYDHAFIAEELILSGASVMLGGGERYFLPIGVEGHHGPGTRHDGRDLIEEARARGYTVVRTQAELLALPDDVEKVLGLFAADHTFDARSEENLAADGSPLYDPAAPSVAVMTSVALRILGQQGDQFLLIVEEEGTDNFGNCNNAAGVLEAIRRADEAIGVARAFLRHRPDTLILTAADSDAGGMRMLGLPTTPGGEVPLELPPVTANGAPMDGREGTRSAPFLAAPDRSGTRLPFAIVWADFNDLSGGILARAEGLHAGELPATFDNTDVARLIRRVLFGADQPR